MKVILYGSSGMIGSAVLIEALADGNIEKVLLVNRTASAVQHDKVDELLLPDFLDYSSATDRLSGYDACLYCLGISASGMSEADYTRITYDYTMAAARTLHALNPAMIFCFISGAGTSSSGNSRNMWARVKGRAENDLQHVGFPNVYSFRPAYIQPVKGVKSRTPMYNAMYRIFGPFYPLIRMFGPRYILTSERLALAMIAAARDGYEKSILESVDINKLADRAVA